MYVYVFILYMYKIDTYINIQYVYNMCVCVCVHKVVNMFTELSILQYWYQCDKLVIFFNIASLRVPPTTFTKMYFKSHCQYFYKRKISATCTNTSTVRFLKFLLL